MIPFIKYKNIFLALTLVLVAGSIAAIGFCGLKPGIEFTGGSVLEIDYKDARPDMGAIREKIAEFKVEAIYATGDKGIMIRTENLDATAHGRLLEKLKEAGSFEEKSFESIGPVVGKELTSKMTALVLISPLPKLAMASHLTPTIRKKWKCLLPKLVMAQTGYRLVGGSKTKTSISMAAVWLGLDI